MSTSRHLSAYVDRPAKDVYAYASNPANLPEWAPGLCRSIEQIDGDWVAESPMGTIVIKFAEGNEYGILDHDVTVPSGETFYNPMRVIADGAGCEVVFTLRRRPELTDDAFARDTNAVQADLDALKELIEGR